MHEIQGENTLSTEIRAQRRADILQAATLEFTARGFTRAKMGEIARRAGIGKSTVYEYFPSKNELLTAVLEESFRKMHEFVTLQMEKPVDFRTKLIYLMENAGDMLRGMLSVLVNLRDSEPAIAYIHANGEREKDFILSLLEKNVRQAMLKQELRDDLDPHFAAALILAMLITISNDFLENDTEQCALTKTVDYLLEGLAPEAR